MDKDLQNILNKANKDKKDEVHIPLKKAHIPSEPYDYLVFTKLMQFTGFQKAVFFIIIPGGISTLFFLNGKAWAILCLGIYTGLLLLYVLINYVRFQKFRGWQERLPFILDGFKEMIGAKRMFCDLCWNDTQITVNKNGNDDEINKVIEASLKLFCERCEMAFYEKKMESKSERYRKHWVVTSALSAQGSANTEVMRYMKDLFEREFTMIAKKTNAITSVKVELLSEEFEVSIEIDNGD